MFKGGEILARFVGQILFRKRPTFGDARWASDRELSRAGMFGNKGLILGKIGRRYVRLPEMLHVISYGSTKSGKTTGLIIPNLISNTDWTFVVNDPKGELALKTAAHRAKMGNRVIILDFTRPDRSMPYDPMSFLRQSDGYSLDSDLTTLANLTVPTALDERSSHFSSMAQKIIAGTAGYFWDHSATPVSFPEVIRELTAMGQEHREALFKKLAAVDAPACRAAVNAFDEAGERERGSFVTTLANRTAIWLDRGVAELCGEHGFTWEEIFDDTRPTTVYVITPLGLGERYGPVMRMILGLCTASINRRYARTRKPLARPFCLMIDEAGLMGYNESVAEGVAYVRAANVSIVLAFQSPTQVEKHYPDPITLQGGCEAWQISGGDKYRKLYDEVSALIGDATVQSQGESRGRRWSSESQSEAARRLIKPEEIRALPKDQAVLLVGPHNIQCRKAFFFEDPAIKRQVRDA